MSDKEQPRCIEVTASYSAGGKIAIENFNWSSDWHASMSRKFSIPEGWSDEEVEAFHYAQWQAIYDVVDPIDNEESEKRRKASSVAEVRLGEDE